MNTARAANRGVTRFELMVGSAILAVVVGLGSWWLGSKAEDDAQAVARSKAAKLLTAASDWKRQHDIAGCPSVTQLLVDKNLRRGEATDDPWGGRFKISCEADRVQVRSAGGDQRFSTADDIELGVVWRS